jgi:hypothetical protein
MSTRGPAWPGDYRSVTGLAGVPDPRVVRHCTASCAALAATVMAQVLGERPRDEVLGDFVAALERNVSQSQATVLSNVLAVFAALLKHSSPVVRLAAPPRSI